MYRLPVVSGIQNLFRWIALPAFVVWAWPAPLAGQDAATLAGTVSDVATGQTLESASVRLDGAASGVLTNSSGRYVIAGVRPGTHEVTFDIIGYKPQTLTVDVSARGTTILDAELTAAALGLQELVVTGVARATPRIKLPFTVEKLDIASVQAPVISAESFLAGRLPGVKVVRGVRPTRHDGQYHAAGCHVN